MTKQMDSAFVGIEIEYDANFMYLFDARYCMLRTVVSIPTSSNRAAFVRMIQIQYLAWQRLEAHLGDMLHVVEAHEEEKKKKKKTNLALHFLAQPANAPSGLSQLTSHKLKDGVVRQAHRRHIQGASDRHFRRRNHNRNANPPMASVGLVDLTSNVTIHHRGGGNTEYYNSAALKWQRVCDWLWSERSLC